MMDYKKEFQEGYTYYHFDKIVPIEKIIFNQKITTLEWSINHYHNTKMVIEDTTVHFTDVHLKHLRILGDVTINEVILGEGFIVEEAIDATNVFIRNSGWSGADGVYQHQIENKIHWYFSDTFVGDVDEATRIRKPGYAMVNNTLGVSHIEKPFLIEFLVKQINDTYDSYFKPIDEGYYWLQDGIYLDNYFYLTMIRVVNLALNKGFAVVDVDTVKIPYKDNQLLVDEYERIPTNYYLTSNEDTYTFGASILDDRDNSGYIYVFGYDAEKKRNCVVSRVKKHIINDDYEYLTENGWQKEAKQLKSIAKDIACEFKVIYDRDCYLISYTKNGIGKEIIIGKTNNIDEGFKAFTCVYECLESDQDETIITYNAKFQVLPNLNEYYITYHVNTLINEAHDDANIYYPRWIKLKRRYGKL